MLKAYNKNKFNNKIFYIINFITYLCDDIYKNNQQLFYYVKEI